MTDVSGGSGQGIRRLRWLILAAVVGLAVLYAVAVLTPIGQVLGDWALIGNAELAHARVRRASRLLHLINVRSSTALFVLIIVVGASRRRLRTGIVTAAGFGCAVLAAEVLKAVLPRPELDRQWEQYLVDKSIDTFPSGHVAIATAFVLALVVVAPPRLRAWIAGIGSVLVAWIGMGVVIAGWHRPSDSVGGALLAAACMATASLILVSRRAIEPSWEPHRLQLGLAIAGVAVLVGMVVLTRQADAILPDGVEPAVFPIAVLGVAVTCLALVQVGSRLLCVPAEVSPSEP